MSTGEPHREPNADARAGAEAGARAGSNTDARAEAGFGAEALTGPGAGATLGADTSPHVDAWVVRRRWMPRLGRDRVGGHWRRRTKGTRGRAQASMDLMDAGELADVPFLGWIAMAAALIGMAIFLTLVLVPLLFALADLLFLLLLALGGLAARVLFRRPWLVDAHHREGRGLRWRVVGWRASNAFAAEARDLLAAGIVPPGAEELSPDTNPTQLRDPGPNHPTNQTGPSDSTE